MKIGKREQNKQQRRCAIVAIATRSFLEQGYAATSMSAIADELGGSKATMWAHFASKEELLAAVIDQLVSHFESEMVSTLQGQSFTLAGLRQYCLRFLSLLMEEDGIRLFRLVIAEGGRFPEIAAVFHDRAPVQMQRLIASYFATQFSAQEAAHLGRLVHCTMAGYRAYALTRPELPHTTDLEQFVDDFIAHLRLPAYGAAFDGSLS